MRRDLIHSAEGTHWTKKNHKYIRKEGNRYIYADDLKTGRASREQIGARQYKTEQGIRERSQAQRRQDASNGIGARNQEFAKAQSSLQRTKQLYKSTGGKAPMEYKVGGMTLKRASTPIPDTAVEKAKAITQQRNRAANGNGARNQQYAKAATVQRKRVNAVNNQGATNWWNGRSKNNNNGYEYAKKENDWTQLYPGTISAKRKKAMYSQGTKYNSPGNAQYAKMDNTFRAHFGNHNYNSMSSEGENRDYSKSVKANRGKTFVNSLKEKFGPMNKKKDQLVKRAKDFFNKIDAKRTEKKYVSKLYDERSGRPKSYSTHESNYGAYAKGQDPNSLLGPTTGNAGASNLRKGVEAGRKRAGIKKSPGVQGLENNLRNRGYETSHGPSKELGSNNDTRRGSYRDGAIDINDYSRGWRDLSTADSKQRNEEYRQRIDKSRSRATGQPDELKRGTEAGRKREAKRVIKKKAKETQERIKPGIGAGRVKHLGFYRYKK